MIPWKSLDTEIGTVFSKLRRVVMLRQADTLWGRSGDPTPMRENKNK